MRDLVATCGTSARSPSCAATSSIVLGLGDLEVLERHASEADRAVNAVSEVWGTSWAQRIVVIAPSDTAQLAAILGGSDGDYDQIAAVTTGHFLTGHTATSADRVLLNPDAFAELSSVGRRVVLTHETTHVAARAASTGSTAGVAVGGVRRLRRLPQQ